MRQPTLWRRFFATQTDVGGDVNGPVGSGNFQGGNVTINMPTTGRRIRGRRPRREPRSERQFLKALWLLQVDGERQSRAWRQFASRWLILLTVGIIVSLSGWVAVVMQWQSRFGWLW